MVMEREYTFLTPETGFHLPDIGHGGECWRKLISGTPDLQKASCRSYLETGRPGENTTWPVRADIWMPWGMQKL